MDKWPFDSSRGARDVRIHLLQHSRDVIDTKNPVEIEKEALNLERLISNHYRNKHPLPQGLGGPPPEIAATGLDLHTVSTILASKGDGAPKKGFMARALRFFS